VHRGRHAGDGVGEDVRRPEAVQDGGDDTRALGGGD
jgi:hypothetical protein